MKITEDHLCEVFADAVRDMPAFRRWILGRTKFAFAANEARLLHDEQMTIRPRKRWWRHWWCAVPGHGERETDIFMVFEVPANGERFALHVENKCANSRFLVGQAAAYAPRARHMLNNEAYLSHSDAETILIAPNAIRTRFAGEAELFDVVLSYEDIADYLPAFRVQE